MLTERLDAAELMDDPALDAATYRSVLADLAKVNRLTLAYRPTLAFLARAVGKRQRFRVLDIGFGNGDMLRRVARWAARREIAADLTGIDLNPRSQAAAERAASPGAPIRFISGDYRELAGAGFDCVISSLVAHHMSESELVDFVRFMEAEAAAGWFVNDLHRHAFAFHAWPILAGAMQWHRIVRIDGHTSIARSFRPSEWRELLDREGLPEATVRRWFPFRLCVERVR